ncbi:MAG: TlpA family protein disulfide reductase [Burkholderiales bacterium]
MSRIQRSALFAVVAAAALATGFLLSPTRPAPADSQALLQASLPDLEGNSQRLARWQGKVMVVNFWATWCQPCLEEIPQFVRMQRQLGSRGLQFIGIAVDRPDSVKAFVTAHGVNYPVLIGGVEAIGISRQAGNTVGGLPYTLVVDRFGRIVSQHQAGLTEAKLRPIVEQAL